MDLLDSPFETGIGPTLFHEGTCRKDDMSHLGCLCHEKVLDDEKAKLVHPFCTVVRVCHERIVTHKIKGLQFFLLCFL